MGTAIHIMAKHSGVVRCFLIAVLVCNASVSGQNANQASALDLIKRLQGGEDHRDFAASAAGAPQATAGSFATCPPAALCMPASECPHTGECASSAVMVWLETFGLFLHLERSHVIAISLGDFFVI